MAKRLTDADLEEIQKEVEEKGIISFNGKKINLKNIKKSQLTFGVLSRTGSGEFTKKFKEICQELEKFFEATNNPEASYKQKKLLSNFKYYNDLMFSATDFFSNHISENNNAEYFSSDIYELWLGAVELGLYSAPENCVLSREGLNYPDNKETSPRLEKVKEYMRYVYFRRFVLNKLKESLTSGTSSTSRIASMSPERWADHLNQIQQNLISKLGYNKGKQVFQEVYGEAITPTIPATQKEVDEKQKKVLDRLAEELLLKHNSEPKEEPESTKTPENNSPPSNSIPPIQPIKPLSDFDFQSFYEKKQREKQEKQEKLEQILKEIKEKNLPNCSSLSEVEEKYFSNSEEEQIQNAIFNNIKKHKSEWTIQDVPTIFGYSQTKEKMLVHQSASLKYDKEGYLENNPQLIQPVNKFSKEQQIEIENLFKNTNQEVNPKKNENKINWWYFLLLIPLILVIYLWKKFS